MTIRNFDALFAPRAIALVGASDKAGSVGSVIARNLLHSDFSGQVILVNQRAQIVEGVKVFADITALPATPDLAVIATPAPTVPAAIAQLGAQGCRAAVVISAGFGPHDSALRQAMLDAARPHLMRILGPNCLGFQSPAAGVNASFAHVQPAPGKIALVSQSGAILASLLDWAAGRGIGFSHVVSLGDMSDIDFGDMLDYLALDASTQAILLYVENITHARKFMSAGRIAARAKPVIVIKSGRSQSGARAAATHTGALAGADLAYDAAFRRAGMLRVDELDELFGAVEMLAAGMRVSGDKLTIVTNGGGAGVLAADELEAGGGALAPLTEPALRRLDAVLPAGWSRANPIDIIGDAREDRYRAAMDIIVNYNAQDAVLAMNCPTGVADSAASAAAVIDVAAKATLPLLTCWLGDATARKARALFETARIPTFETPSQAVRAFLQLHTYRKNQLQLLQTPAMSAARAPDRESARAIVQTALGEGRRMLTEPEAKAVVSAYGLPIVETLIARTPEDAQLLAQRLGGPVALKIFSPDISHKSDVGGVSLNLDPAHVEAEARAMTSRLVAKASTARLQGFTVQRMIETSKATELLAGVHIDPTFGPIILFGAGGVAVEVIADRAMSLAPLNMALASDLIDRTRVTKLLRGYRNVAPANRTAIESALVSLSNLVCDIPEIAALDINPLLASASGVIALDARVELRRPPKKSDLAIRPYPADLQRPLHTADAEYLCRPIRPEDEPALIAMAQRCKPDDLRLRFRGALQSLSHEMAARLSQIDYDREMAFIALEADDIVGVAHLIFDPDFQRADFAILVRSDKQGRGLGAALMHVLLDHAGSRGAITMVGDMLPQNVGMIAMARALGAEIQNEAGLVTARFDVSKAATP